jgi:hypothetical protein
VRPVESQEWNETFYPLGYPVEITANSDAVLLAARESWAESRQAFFEKPVQIRALAVADGITGLPANPSYRIEHHLMSVVADAANHAVADLTTGFAWCVFGESALQDRRWLRYYFLDAIAYTILDSVFFTPVHAACVAWNDRGVLLCGDSEVGKSSLSYACARQGWTFVSDDASHLIHGGDRIAIGNPHQLRLREPAHDLFPELRSWLATLRANGKMTIEVHTRNLAGIQTAPQARIHRIVFLNRRPGPIESRPFHRDEALRRMQQVLAIKHGPIVDSYMRDLSHLLDAGIVELSYQDLGAAVRELESLVSES